MSLLLALGLSSAATAAQPTAAPPAASLRFAISYSKDLAPGPLDGRILLILSKDDQAEPRKQIEIGLKTQQIFGVDVDRLAPGAPAVVDASVLGYPLESLSHVPKGTYVVQAVLHRYETFHRADGHVVKLPMDRGEGQHWNLAPGNLISKPRKVDVDPAKGGTVAVALDGVIPPIPEPKTTRYVRHERIRSERLSKFWGRDMFLGAHVLLPLGFDEHPNARYPFVIFHGHFPETFEGFREEPPDPNLKPEYSERFRLEGYNRIQEEQAHQLYKDWTSPGFPRAIVVEIQHANPYYDDSYAVNSANLGPYGDAIQYELIPYLERKYRAIGAGWARFAYGGSTGGWEAMAVQIFYPDDYNGIYAACPDPIDFRANTVFDLYADSNAYYPDAPWKTDPAPRPPGLLRPHRGDRRGHEPVRARPRDEGPLGRAVGHLAGRLLPRRRRRLPEADLGQEDGRHRQGGCGVLEGALRPHGDPETRLGQGAREEARGQAPHLRRRGGQLLPEQRRRPRGRSPEVREEPAVRRVRRLRAARRALLERRPHAPERDLAPEVPPVLPAEDRRAHQEDGAGRSGPQELGLLGLGTRGGGRIARSPGSTLS